MHGIRCGIFLAHCKFYFCLHLFSFQIFLRQMERFFFFSLSYTITACRPRFLLLSRFFLSHLFLSFVFFFYLMLVGLFCIFIQLMNSKNFNSLLFVLACNHFSPSGLMFAFHRFCFQLIRPLCV